MRLGTKNRQKQTAAICKLHLWEKYRDQRWLVEEFILEFEGGGKNSDVTCWNRFIDIKDIKKEMLKRLEAHPAPVPFARSRYLAKVFVRFS